MASSWYTIYHIFHSAHGSIYEQFDFQASNLLDCDQADALQEIDQLLMLATFSFQIIAYH